MDAFSITCTTCNSRLKVQSLSAVGQILACPNCQSMVKVEPPAGWTPPSHEDLADAAGDDQTAGRAPQSPAPSAEDNQTPSVSNSFDDAVDLLAGKPVPAGKAEMSTRPKNLSTAAARPRWRESDAAPSGHDEAPLLPDSTWTSKGSRKRLLVGGIAAAVLLLCIAAFAVGRALTPDSDKPQQAAAIENESTETFDETGDEPMVEPDSDGSDSHDSTGSEKTASGADDGQQIDAEPVADDATVKDAAAHSPEDSVPDNPTPEDPADEDSVDEDVSGEADRTPPANLDGPPGLVEKGEDEPAEDLGYSAASLLAELDKFSELMDEPTIVGRSAEADEVADVLTPGEVPGKGPALPRPEAREVDVAARLEDPLAEIEVKEVPLADFVRFVSDFSTIPVSLTPEALTQRQISPKTPVSIRRSDTTVGQVLRDVLSTLELGIVHRDKQLVIVATASSESDSLRPVEYHLSDLSAGSDQDVKLIAAWVTALISPKTWQVNGGPGGLEVKGTSLTVRQSEPIHFQVLTFCEKLRVARGLPLQSSYPAELFRLDARTGKSSDVLNRSVSMNYLDDVRFVEILQRAREQSGVPILINWHALAESGWNPDARFPFSVDRKPLRQMLDRLLNQMELTYHVTDANMIQITTEKRLMNRAEIELHRADDLVSERFTAEQIITGIKSTLGEVHFLDHAGAIRFDPKSGYLIAALPQSQQQAVARILARLRKREPESAD